MNALHELAREIAQELGKPWEADEVDASFYTRIIHPDGAKLSVRFDKDKLRVTGVYPGGLPYTHRHDGAYGTEKPPYISVSKSRGAATIAKEINRRFLPKYLPLFEQCKKNQAEEQSYEQEKAAARESLAAAFGGKIIFDSSVHFRVPSCHGSAEVHGSIGVKLEDMSLDAALRLAEFLKDES